jgi:hypothetical protein
VKNQIYPNKNMHLFPWKIALRAQRLLQGSLFYYIFVDTATGQYFRITPNGEQKIKELLISYGWSEENYELSWSCFKDYLGEFSNPSHQNAIYDMISHWDWYISNLGKFIHFAESHISPYRGVENSLLRINRLPFINQIELIEKSTDTKFSLDNYILTNIEEMHLVRNLGMHNEWEVDGDYLKHTKTTGWKIGQKRQFDINELEGWHSAFIKLITVISNDIAVLYAQTPDYN